jgi:hypothetical protein
MPGDALKENVALFGRDRRGSRHDYMQLAARQFQHLRTSTCAAVGQFPIPVTHLLRNLKDDGERGVPQCPNESSPAVLGRFSGVHSPYNGI